MVEKKGDDNGSQGVNRTELNGVIQMNCLTMAGQSPRRACPQIQDRARRLVTSIKIKYRQNLQSQQSEMIQVRQRRLDSRGLP